MSRANGMVYIVDDDPSFRKSLERLLNASGFTTQAFGDAATFLAHTLVQHPACLLLDIDLPDLDGIALQQKLIGQGSRLPIIFVSGRGSIAVTVKAMKAGAVDFLAKPFEKGELFSAIEVALENDIQVVQQEATANKARKLIDALTPREVETLRWVIAGKHNKEIAFELGIAEKTVKIHRGHVMMKLEATSVADLVRLAALAEVSPAECVAA